MIVMKKNPVPMYEVSCEECGSVIRFSRSELNLDGSMFCPVCKSKVFVASEIISPVEYLENYHLNPCSYPLEF